MVHYVSRGGFGDAWIAFLKIRAMSYGLSKCNVKFWTHCFRREEHRRPIKELMALMPDFICTEELFGNGKQVGHRVASLVKSGYKQISSKASELTRPNPDLSFLAEDPPHVDQPYTIINPEAGKPANWRAINSKVLDELCRKTQRPVLLGKDPEHTDTSGCIAIDMCGKTTVAELINWIYHSEKFFAFDGAIAYMAMSMGKTGTILFTHEEKRNGASDGYMCNRWRKQARVGFCDKRLSRMDQIKWDSPS